MDPFSDLMTVQVDAVKLKKVLQDMLVKFDGVDDTCEGLQEQIVRNRAQINDVGTLRRRMIKIHETVNSISAKEEARSELLSSVVNRLPTVARDNSINRNIETTSELKQRVSDQADDIALLRKELEHAKTSRKTLREGMKRMLSFSEDEFLTIKDYTDGQVRYLRDLVESQERAENEQMRLEIKDLQDKVLWLIKVVMMQAGAVFPKDEASTATRLTNEEYGYEPKPVSAAKPPENQDETGLTDLDHLSSFTSIRISPRTVSEPADKRDQLRPDSKSKKYKEVSRLASNVLQKKPADGDTSVRSPFVPVGKQPEYPIYRRVTPRELEEFFESVDASRPVTPIQTQEKPMNSEARSSLPSSSSSSSSSSLSPSSSSSSTTFDEQAHTEAVKTHASNESKATEAYQYSAASSSNMTSSSSSSSPSNSSLASTSKLQSTKDFNEKPTDTKTQSSSSIPTPQAPASSTSSSSSSSKDKPAPVQSDQSRTSRSGSLFFVNLEEDTEKSDDKNAASSSSSSANTTATPTDDNNKKNTGNTNDELSADSFVKEMLHEAAHKSTTAQKKSHSSDSKQSNQQSSSWSRSPTSNDIRFQTKHVPVHTLDSASRARSMSLFFEPVASDKPRSRSETEKQQQQHVGSTTDREGNREEERHVLPLPEDFPEFPGFVPRELRNMQLGLESSERAGTDSKANTSLSTPSSSRRGSARATSRRITPNVSPSVSPFLLQRSLGNLTDDPTTNQIIQATIRFVGEHYEKKLSTSSIKYNELQAKYVSLSHDLNLYRIKLDSLANRSNQVQTRSLESPKSGVTTEVGLSVLPQSSSVSTQIKERSSYAAPLSAHRQTGPFNELAMDSGGHSSSSLRTYVNMQFDDIRHRISKLTSTIDRVASNHQLVGQSKNIRSLIEEKQLVEHLSNSLKTYLDTNLAMIKNRVRKLEVALDKDQMDKDINRFKSMLRKFAQELEALQSRHTAAGKTGIKCLACDQYTSSLGTDPNSGETADKSAVLLPISTKSSHGKVYGPQLVVSEGVPIYINGDDGNIYKGREGEAVIFNPPGGTKQVSGSGQQRFTAVYNNTYSQTISMTSNMPFQLANKNASDLSQTPAANAHQVEIIVPKPDGGQFHPWGPNNPPPNKSISTVPQHQQSGIPSGGGAGGMAVNQMRYALPNLAESKVPYRQGIVVGHSINGRGKRKHSATAPSGSNSGSYSARRSSRTARMRGKSDRRNNSDNKVINSRVIEPGLSSKASRRKQQEQNQASNTDNNNRLAQSVKNSAIDIVADLVESNARSHTIGDSKQDEVHDEDIPVDPQAQGNGEIEEDIQVSHDSSSAVGSWQENNK